MTPPLTLIKQPAVSVISTKSRSTIYDEIKSGLMPPPVRLGGNSVEWLEHEIYEINAARIAGKSDDDIRQLVTKLVADRQGKQEGVATC